MKPLVSIVIPVYNRESLISRAIESASKQTYSNIEIIIVDNHSTDKTWEVLKQHAAQDSRIRIFRNEENVGPVLNWKECFKHSRGEYLKILWSDDWMSDDFIEKAMLKFDNDTAFVLSGYSITYGSKSSSNTYFEEEYRVQDYLDNILMLNKEKFPVSPGCAVFRRSDVLNSFFYSPIPNNENLNSMNNGAGNDLLLYLDIAIDYKYIRTTGSIDNFFYAHLNSITIKAKDLSLYYSWAKLYFLKKNKLHSAMNLFKLNLLLNIICGRNKYRNIYDSASYNLSSFSEFKKMIFFFFEKCHYHLKLRLNKSQIVSLVNLF